MGVALTLPRAGAVTDELLAPVLDISGETLSALRGDLVEALRSLASDLPGGERFVLDAYRFSTARRHPERCGTPEPFAPSPARCRRAVGLAAVDRCLRRRARGPVEAVGQVLETGVDDAALVERGEAPRAPWWAKWYASLGPGGRAVVAAEAVTWCTQLWTALAWDRFPVRPQVGGRDDWWDEPSTGALTLHGRAEVRARVGQRPVLVVVHSSVPDAAATTALAFPALVAGLAGGPRAIPGRVVGLWPTSGQVRVLEVEEGALRRCADDVLSAVGTWVDAAQSPDGVSRSAK
ncbi:MAG TPA: hypothetical protein VMV14_02985 [Acidimicrobiales bacterium]|nr:hypothetical protein [Acidimicrobiales bacterium]